MAALIPPDVGMRMRLPSDSPILAPSPVKEISSDLPDLHPGQVFSARIQEVLPEYTYKALVAGRQLTLSLPEGAKPGDTLELVVIDRTGKTIVARQSNAPVNESAENLYQHTTLSPTAQLIGKLLADQPRQPSTPLNRGTPLLTAPPTLASSATTAPQLASALATAVSVSGLFYESHQAQWVAGKRPLPALLQEPQAKFGSAREIAGAIESGHSDGKPVATAQAPAQSVAEAVRNEERNNAAVAATATTPAKLPDELRPLVQQQLEAAASNRLLWHGEVWPGQKMEWEIEEEAQRSTSDNEETGASWNSTLRLSTPRLGNVEARLRLRGDTLQLILSTPYGASAADLQDELPSLSKALAAAGITLATAQVRYDAAGASE